MNRKYHTGRLLVMLTVMVLCFSFGCDKENVNGPCHPTGGQTSALFNRSKAYGTVTDQNGNVYKTITIGKQTWMAENLRAACFRNGEVITEVTDSIDWMDITTAAYCNYHNSNNADAIATYGRLYNWYAATDSRNVAPAGWHVPTLDEWMILENFLGNDTIAAGKLKEVGTTHWEIPLLGSNESGFTALPGGMRAFSFVSMGEFGYWWTASEGATQDDRAWHRSISINSIWIVGDVSALNLMENPFDA